MALHRKTDLLNIDRRDFIKASVLVTGGLILGVDFSSAQEHGQAGQETTRNPAGFIHITPDDTITLILPAVEMGQGTHTGFSMIMMEELEGDWSKMKVIDAPVADLYKNPMFHEQTTVGSVSVRGWYQDLRKTAAAARVMLIQAAASHWNVPVAECTANNSVITHRASGRTVTFGAVADQAATLTIPQNPELKPANQFRYIGKPLKRIDTVVKTDGSAKYGIDMSVPGMVYAAVKTCPTVGGKLESFDDTTAKKVAGYLATVALENGVVAVASSYWQAKKALDQIIVDYSPGKLIQLNSKKISAILHKAVSEPLSEIRNDGDVQAAFNQAQTFIEATYEVPYLAHACMEPMNCTAHVTSDACEVWTGTQSPERAKNTVAAILDMPHDKISIHCMYLGGGFGRRGETDYVAQAVQVSKAIGRPVKLIWSREEDIQKDFYRPAVLGEYKGGFDEQGNLTALSCKIITSSTPDLHIPGPPIFTRGVVDAPYHLANFNLSAINKDVGVRFGFWRSVPHSHTGFALETFIDECAHQVDQDPYLFRRALLQTPKAKRPLNVLNTLAKKAGWGEPLPAGRYQGISIVDAFGSLLGNVAEISVTGNAIKLHRVVCVIDCGVAVNPAQIAAQLEGGMVYGLTAALFGEITIENGAVQQSNFHDYRVLKINEMPDVEVHVIESDEYPGGVGEVASALIAPALGNAIFSATGKRIRSLPLNKHGFTFA